MDGIQRKHAARGLVGLLILVNLVTLATLWYSYLKRPPLGRPPQDGRPGQEIQSFLARELGLTPDQSKKFDDLRDKFISTPQAIQEEILRLKQAMMAEIFAERPDEAKVEALAAEIGAKEAQKIRLLYAHFRDLAAVCTPEQKRKFQSIMSDLMRMFGPPGPPPPGAGKPQR